MSWSAGEQARRLHGLVRIGRVTAVDPGRARARVSLGGETETAWLPWTGGRAGSIREWAPVTVGEQVVVLSPGGETGQGVIAGSLFSAAHAAPSNDGAAHRLELGGSSITMTGDAITLQSNGSSLTLDAAGIRLNGARIDLN
ncbi:baseplate assembly protein [Roseovarius sp. 22II1-1F6A]|nr:baseplate assembly protein [Roseovarius sp. 22II1-1F6A]